MAKKIERPTVSEVEVHCEKCNQETDIHHMTNHEIHIQQTIKQWCKTCGKVTEWRVTTFEL